MLGDALVGNVAPIEAAAPLQARVVADSPTCPRLGIAQAMGMPDGTRLVPYALAHTAFVVSLGRMPLMPLVAPFAFVAASALRSIVVA